METSKHRSVKKSKHKRGRRSDRRYAIHFIVMAAATVFVIGGCISQPIKSKTTLDIQDWSEDGLLGRRITTPHFDIFSTVTDHPFEAALPEFLESAFERYQETLPGGPRTKLSIYLFGCRPQWEQFARQRFPYRLETYSRIRAGGFTEGNCAVLFYTDRPTALATLAHEGWHQYVNASAGQGMPAWLNEGLACYHEAVEWSGRKPRLTLGRNIFRVEHLRQAVRRDRLLSLPELLNTHAGEVIRQDNSTIAQTYYAQAWGLVDFLHSGAGGRYAPGLEQMLRDIAQGAFAIRVRSAQLPALGKGEMTEAEAAFREYLGQHPAALEEQYQNHLIRLADFH